MADEADTTDQHAELLTQANLYGSRKDEPQGLANGNCWFCDNEVEAGRRWCCPECRDDWEREG